MHPIQLSIVNKLIEAYKTGRRLILNKEESAYHLEQMKKLKSYKKPL